MAVENKNPNPDVSDIKPASQNTTYQQTEAAATQRIRDEQNGTNNNSDATRNNNNNDSHTLGTPDAHDGTTENPESPTQMMLREVESVYKAGAELAKYFTSGLSPETLQKFGTPSFTDSAASPEEAESRVASATAEARNEDAEKKVEAPKTGDSSTEQTLTTALSDFGSWASDTFNKYVAEPIKEAASDVMDVFGSATDWMFNTSDTFKATGSVADLNNITSKQFQQERNEAYDRFNYDLDGARDSSGEKLELPAGSTQTGTVEIGGNQVNVMRSPEGDTYLMQGDQVIAKQGADGSYGVNLRDGSQLNFKLDKGEDGKYKIDHLERTKDGQLQQKIQDGVFYNYNYDSNGNRTSVDAAADLQGPVSQEQLDKIRQELGDNGTAAIRVNGNDHAQRLLMQTHGNDTHSITDIDAKRAQIFHNGQEYRLNENDQLGLVDKDDKWQEPAQTSAEQQQQIQQLADLMRQLGKRAQGDSDLSVGGVKIHTDGDGGPATIERVDLETGETQTTTQIPAGTDQPITVTNSNGETAHIEGNNIGLDGPDNKPLFDFNELNGLMTDQFKFDENGITDLETNSNLLDGDGNIVDGTNWIDGESFDEMYFENEAHEAEHEAITSQAVQDVVSQGSLSLSISRSGNPASVELAKHIANNALAQANGALAALGNDLMCQVSIYSNMGIAEDAVKQADRESRTQTYAARLGITDATRLAEFNRIGTLSSTAFSPEEFVRDRLRAAA